MCFTCTLYLDIFLSNLFINQISISTHFIIIKYEFDIYNCIRYGLFCMI